MINRSNSVVDSYVRYVENENDPLYVYGLKGIGKSYILYQMAAKLITMDDKYRVVYINLTDLFVIEDTLAITKAIIKYDCETDAAFNSKFQSYCTIDRAFVLADFMNYKVVDESNLTALISQIKYLFVYLEASSSL